VQANGVGKIKMILQSVGITVLLIFVVFPMPLLLPLAKVLLYFAVVASAISLFVYRSI
jgi:phosphatidylglycerophosphate synthase